MLKSRCRTGGVNIDREGVPNETDTHKKGVTESEVQEEGRRKSKPEAPRRVVDVEKFKN